MRLLCACLAATLRRPPWPRSAASPHTREGCREGAARPAARLLQERQSARPAATLAAELCLSESLTLLPGCSPLPPLQWTRRTRAGSSPLDSSTRTWSGSTCSLVRHAGTLGLSASLAGTLCSVPALLGPWGSVPPLLGPWGSVPPLGAVLSAARGRLGYARGAPWRRATWRAAARSRAEPGSCGVWQVGRGPASAWFPSPYSGLTPPCAASPASLQPARTPSAAFAALRPWSNSHASR